MNKAASAEGGARDGFETLLGENRVERFILGKRVGASRVMLGSPTSRKLMLPVRGQWWGGKKTLLILGNATECYKSLSF